MQGKSGKNGTKGMGRVMSEKRVIKFVCPYCNNELNEPEANELKMDYDSCDSDPVYGVSVGGSIEIKCSRCEKLIYKKPFINRDVDY